MNYNIELKAFGHNWEKQNLVTLFDKNGSYDLYQCKRCGISGRTTSLATISIDGRTAKDKVYNCSGGQHVAVPKRIRITNCSAAGRQFANLTTGSEHDVVEPPKGYKNDSSGVWVMGVGEPVKVLSDEFKTVC